MTALAQEGGTMKTNSRNEDDLVTKLLENQKTGKIVKTTLSTDERDLARIWDGIYRQPSAALRELVANAYDADASIVIIHTDPPRFDTISIKDDGIGMDERTLVHLIHHIGGSAKRAQLGARLGLTNPKDPSLSPG